MNSTRHAFSLVELSIVLVILGLITGGVLAGQSLIRAAEIRKVVSDIGKYQEAYSNFKTKYQSVPGDMPDATANWGIRAGTGSDATCFNTTGSFTGTCNGNGDNRVDWEVQYFERFLFWQHLSLAGLIEDKFTGASEAPLPNTLKVGTNVPKSTIMSGASYGIGYLSGPISGDANNFDGPYNVSALYTYYSTPEELWSIDTKIDDGKPATGMIQTYKLSSPWAPNCATTNANATAEYNVTNKTNTCMVISTLK